jgi:hypothetical protein
MSLGKIGRIIDALRHERYRFSPVSITVAVFRSVTVLWLSVAHDSSGAATYRHLLSAGPVQAASAARRVL